MRRKRLAVRETSGSGTMANVYPFRSRTPEDGQAIWPPGCSPGFDFAESLMAIMDIRPDWTALALACENGPVLGSLALEAKSVTAVTFSKEGFQSLRRQCLENGIRNIIPVFDRWDDDPYSIDVGSHDVVLMSWPLHFSDTPHWMFRLDRLARRQVYIFAQAGDGPFDRRIAEAIGRKLPAGPSFPFLYYNILHQHLAVLANVTFVRKNLGNEWGSREEALDAQRRMFPGLTPEEEQMVRKYLAENLMYINGRWRLPYQRESKWMVVWWDKEEGGS